MSYVVGTFNKPPGCALYPTRGDSCWGWVSLHAGEVQRFLSIAKSIILTEEQMNYICTQVGVRKAAYGAYAPILTADKLALVHIVTLSPDWFQFFFAGERRGANCRSWRAAWVGVQDAGWIFDWQICRRPQPLDIWPAFWNVGSLLFPNWLCRVGLGTWPATVAVRLRLESVCLILASKLYHLFVWIIFIMEDPALQWQVPFQY